MSERPAESERSWEQGWEGHSEDQLRRLARLPLAEKLEWLEEAHRVVRQLQAGQAAAEPG